MVCATSGLLKVDCPRPRELPRLTKLIAWAEGFALDFSSAIVWSIGPRQLRSTFTAFSTASVIVVFFTIALIWGLRSLRKMVLSRALRRVCRVCQTKNVTTCCTVASCTASSHPGMPATAAKLGFSGMFTASRNSLVVTATLCA